MGHIEIKRSVMLGHYFEDEETLAAYSYDASGLEEKPLCVIKPVHEEEIRRVLQAANQNRLAIVPRGSGTGIRGAVTKRDAIIIDMRHFDAVERLDIKQGFISVGAGITITKLNELLAKHNYYFPLIPENPLATIGGLISQNHIMEESVFFGDYKKLVLSIDGFDGVGRNGSVKEQDVEKIVGWEGTTAIITKVKLKIYPHNYHKTMNIFSVKGAGEATEMVEKIRGEKGILFMEYLDAMISIMVGLDETPHLVIGYTNERGVYKDILKINEFMQRRKSLEKNLLRKEYILLDDVTIEPSKAAAFEALCIKEGIPCYSHLGSGIMMTAFKAAEQQKQFWNSVVALGGVPVGKHGYGRLKKQYVPATVRKIAIWLKEERDHNHTLNPGVIV